MTKQLELCFIDSSRVPSPEYMKFEAYRYPDLIMGCIQHEDKPTVDVSLFRNDENSYKHTASLDYYYCFLPTLTRPCQLTDSWHLMDPNVHLTFDSIHEPSR